MRRFEVSTGFRGPNITSAPSFHKQRLFSWKGQRHASEVRFKGNMYMNMVGKEMVWGSKYNGQIGEGLGEQVHGQVGEGLGEQVHGQVGEVLKEQEHGKADQVLGK